MEALVTEALLEPVPQVVVRELCELRPFNDRQLAVAGPDGVAGRPELLQRQYYFYHHYSVVFYRKSFGHSKYLVQ